MLLAANHSFATLNAFARQSELSARYVMADCQVLPLPSSSVDVVLAIELVEHISDINLFASEVARVLKPKGGCLITTPARLISILTREPHWSLPGLALLPFALQPIVARKLFRRDYPFPITQQYVTADAVISKFTPLGLEGRSTIGDLIDRLSGRNRLLKRIFKKYLWRLIVITKP